MALTKLPEHKQLPRVICVASSEEDAIVIQPKDLVTFQYSAPITSEKGEMASVRYLGHLRGKAIWLNSDYNWQIVRDEDDEICLIAMPKCA